MRVKRSLRMRLRGRRRIVAGDMLWMIYGIATAYDRYLKWRERRVYPPLLESGKTPLLTIEEKLNRDWLIRGGYIICSRTPTAPIPSQAGGRSPCTLAGPSTPKGCSARSCGERAKTSPVPSTSTSVVHDRPLGFSRYIPEGVDTSTQRSIFVPDSASITPRAGNRGPRHTRRSWNAWGN